MRIFLKILRFSGWSLGILILLFLLANVCYSHYKLNCCNTLTKTQVIAEFDILINALIASVIATSGVHVDILNDSVVLQLKGLGLEVALILQNATTSQELTASIFIAYSYIIKATEALELVFAPPLLLLTAGTTGTTTVPFIFIIICITYIIGVAILLHLAYYYNSKFFTTFSFLLSFLVVLYMLLYVASYKSLGSTFFPTFPYREVFIDYYNLEILIKEFSTYYGSRAEATPCPSFFDNPYMWYHYNEITTNSAYWNALSKVLVSNITHTHSNQELLFSIYSNFNLIVDLSISQGTYEGTTYPMLDLYIEQTKPLMWQPCHNNLSFLEKYIAHLFHPTQEMSWYDIMHHFAFFKSILYLVSWHDIITFTVHYPK